MHKEKETTHNLLSQYISSYLHVVFKWFGCEVCGMGEFVKVCESDPAPGQIHPWWAVGAAEVLGVRSWLGFSVRF